MSEHKAVFGIYKTRVQVERAVDALKADGFRAADISVLLPDHDGSQAFAHSKGTKAPEGGLAGAGTGVVLGGALGWLVGVGALAVPGLGPLIAAGPIISALAGAGVGGAVGGLSGALIGFGIPEYEARRYEGYVKDGGILLSVHVEDADWTTKAKHILEITNASDIATSGEVRAAWRSAAIPPKDLEDINA